MPCACLCAVPLSVTAACLTQLLRIIGHSGMHCRNVYGEQGKCFLIKEIRF